MTIGDSSGLWTKDHHEEINVYRRRTLGGSGKIATLTNVGNLALAALRGYRVHFYSVPPGAYIACQMDEARQAPFHRYIEITATQKKTKCWK